MNNDASDNQEVRSHPYPHVVWIFCDQLRADAVSLMGNDVVRTPNLNRLAESGVVFEQLYVQSSVCCPSRAAMLTGRYPRTIRMQGSPLLDPREITLPEVLQRAGYHTGMFGKLHLTPQQYAFNVLKSHVPVCNASAFAEQAGVSAEDDPAKKNYGFQEVVGFEDLLWGEYRRWLAERDRHLADMLPDMGGTSWEGWQRWHEGKSSLQDVGPTILPAELHPSWFIAESAADFFKRNHADAPCFLHISFVDPHHPWDPPGEVLENYPPREMPLPPRRDVPQQDWPRSLKKRAQTFDYSKVTLEMAKNTIACYYAMVEMIDRAVGRLIEEIESAGEMDNTLFLFVADHGELLGDYGLWRKGSFHYDCMIRVPAFISYPARLPAGWRIRELMQSIDLMPTLLGLLGFPIHSGVQGSDLSKTLMAKEMTGRSWIYTELYTAQWGPYVDCWTVRTPTAKLNFYPSDGMGHLFDLSEDPDERYNLFDDPGRRSLKDEMMALLMEAICRQSDPLPRVLSQF